MNELTKPQNFEEIVRDRVRKVIFEAVPDEQIDKLINKEYERLFQKDGSYYGNKAVSPFERMVRTELEDVYKGKIQEFCAKIIWGDVDSIKLLKKVAKECSGEVLEGLSVRIIQNMAQSIQNGNY